jgi:multiple sugar transport system substrate-binding protein
VFFEAGGQPAHGSAWRDDTIDRVAGEFFSGTRMTIENSWTRPRMPGYVTWQNRTLPILHETLKRGHGFEQAIEELNRLAPSAPAQTRGE